MFALFLQRRRREFKVDSRQNLMQGPLVQKVKREKLRSKSRALSFMAIGSLAVLGTPRSDACTSFSMKGSGDHEFYVAKNYDWLLGDGQVFLMPKGMHHHSMGGKALGLPEFGLEWLSTHASVAFSQFGPGLTISGMNDEGLVIETLVNTSTPLHHHFRKKNDKFELLSLQWVQYQLDLSKSVDDVLRSLESVSIKQAIIPVHFLVCDASETCVVIETDTNGQVHVERSGRDHSEMVLANRDWSMDEKASVTNDADFSMVDFIVSSSKRYAKIKFSLSSDLRPEASTRVLFDLLSSAQMPITKWQIAWNPVDRSVEWKYFNSQDQDMKSQHFSLKDLNQPCSTDTWMVGDLSQKSGATPLMSVEADQMTTRSSEITNKSLRYLSLRTISPQIQLKKSVVAMQEKLECM